MVANDAPALFLPAQPFPAGAPSLSTTSLSLDGLTLELTHGYVEDYATVDPETGMGRLATVIRIDRAWREDEDHELTAHEIEAHVASHDDLAERLDELLADEACSLADDDDGQPSSWQERQDFAQDDL